MLRSIVTLYTLSHVVVANQNVFIGLSLVFLCDGVAFLSVSDNTTQVYWHGSGVPTIHAHHGAPGHNMLTLDIVPVLLPIPAHSHFLSL